MIVELPLTLRSVAGANEDRSRPFSAEGGHRSDVYAGYFCALTTPFFLFGWPPQRGGQPKRKKLCGAVTRRPVLKHGPTTAGARRDVNVPRLQVNQTRNARENECGLEIGMQSGALTSPAALAPAMGRVRIIRVIVELPHQSHYTASMPMRAR